MKKLFTIICFLLCITNICAADTINPVFDQIDELLTRVECGVSLNSYAETLAKIKSDHKKAQDNPESIYNPLLTASMKSVMQILDDYAYIWRGQENEKKEYITGRLATQISSEYSEIKKYRIWIQNVGDVYPMTDVKREILNELYVKLDKAKSASFNGW